VTDLLLTLPGWVLSFGAGILCAIVALVVLRLVNARGAWLRYLPLALAALGYAAADRFVLPELMRSETAFCAIAQATAERTNAQRAGTKPDAYTSFVATDADCASQTLTSRYTAGLPRSAIDPAGLKTVEQVFVADTCGEPQLRRMIAAGWRVENVYDFTDGRPLVMTAAC